MENSYYLNALAREVIGVPCPHVNGALDTSSSGKDGLEVSKAPFTCGHGTPITSRAKAFK